MPVAWRTSRSVETSLRSQVRGASRARPPVLAPGRAAGAVASTSVFQAPQSGHWPAHFGVSPPQASQR